MRRNIIRGALLVALLLGFAIPGAALAGEGKGCSNLGTWFGVTPFLPEPGAPPVPIPPPPWDEMYLGGFSAVVTGKSTNEGTNHFEYPTFDATLMGAFPTAVRIGSMRGNWIRTGGNTFDYTFMGFAFDAAGMPVYIGKVSGQVELILDCQYQKTTAVMEVFLPHMNPFSDDSILPNPLPLGVFYGYRAKVDLPPMPF